MPQKLTQEQFQNRIREIDPSFDVIGEYQGYYFPNGKPRKILLQHECGYKDEYLISSFIRHKCKCRKCNNLIPMTHEMYINKISSINPNIDIIGRFQGTRKKIDCKCKICNHVWSTSAYVLYKHGCPACAGVIKTHEMFCNEVEEKFPNRYIFLTEYKGIHKDITVKNKFCNHQFTTKAANILNGDSKCPYCNSKKILIGFNDLWSTYPKIAKMLENSADGYKVTYNSGKKLNWICPHCKTSYTKAVNDVVNNGLRCAICSDNFPIGEKILYSMFTYLNIDFEYQKKFDWSNGKIYDFYIKQYNMIIEVNGIQHYCEKSNFTHSSLLNIQKNDRYKYTIAKENGIEKYIYIDSSTSDFITIKVNIMNSDLFNIFQLSTLSDNDWANIAQRSLKSFFIICTELWNKGFCVNQIHDKIKSKKSMEGI